MLNSTTYQTTIIFTNRPNSRGGGVSIYVHKSIKYEITEERLENGNHYLWLYIDKLSLNVGAIYKPGDTNIKNFLETYSVQLEQRKRAIIFGDFNIDLLSKDNIVKLYQTEIKKLAIKYQIRLTKNLALG